MPELELLIDSIIQPTPTQRIRKDELEPAFLKESDYPPGWMVYHPVLGVVSKEEADKYNKGIQQQTPSRKQQPPARETISGGTISDDDVPQRGMPILQSITANG
jgi:hypothetical protein